ncbi:MAG: sulfatase-like hydrolase/transferase [Proteobacteria bacterium]|nr:sulfatase-like hydrolase/transferase [Pseudomonadota bacterium]MCP4921551.1 sulfatase-like hydrolase/transferase [Pseudomonadota bacterium]
MLLLLLACSSPPPQEPERAPDVVFVVLDTARADHVSACGYDRPTTPTLDRLVASGAGISCDLVSSGDWTLPSHASFFTGQPVVRHGAHSLPDTGQPLMGTMRIRPLTDTLPTLAEHFQESGYFTAILSGNPVVSGEAGLFRGFKKGRAAAEMGQLWGADMLAAVDDILALAPKEEPLFLFVNIADAHQPWSAVPPGLDWVQAQPEHRPWMKQVYSGAWTGAELEDHLDRAQNGYDYGLYRADEVLDGVLARLDATRDGPRRLVVVSDHGEFLGEHGLVDHGRYLWEPNQRVFMLTSPAIELPAELASLHAFHVVRDGALPSQLAPAESVAYPDLLWSNLSSGTKGVHTSVARWEDDVKWTWTEGACTRVDLAADPGELAPVDVACDPLSELVAAAQASAAAPVEMDPALLERLRAAGYVE